MVIQFAKAQAIAANGVQTGTDGNAIAVLRRVNAAQAAEKLAAKPETYFDQGFVFSDAHGPTAQA